MPGAPWGGSEELWSQAAIRLARAGHEVGASIPWWPNRGSELERLRANGVAVFERASSSSVIEMGIRRISKSYGWAQPYEAAQRWLRSLKPDLVCISNGGVVDDVFPLKACRSLGLPYVNIAQANAEQFWPSDARAHDLIELLQAAQRTFFVSQNNRLLLEMQLGIELNNAEVVFNPFNVHRNAPLRWPDNSEFWNLACVARLEPMPKGQDLIFQVLATERWRNRPVRVTLFGRGNMEKGLRRLARTRNLDEKVVFAGHVDSVEEIWGEHHALLLPSRFEGLPLALVEAMLCCRLPIVSDVAGNAELVTDGVNGFLVPAPTASLLAETMERAWQRRQDWRTMGLEAGRIARERIPEDPVGYFCERLLKTVQR
jgi:glycosyltransferase involved in cell wall biosynthesis